MMKFVTEITMKLLLVSKITRMKHVQRKKEQPTARSNVHLKDVQKHGIH